MTQEDIEKYKMLFKAGGDNAELAKTMLSNASESDLKQLGFNSRAAMQEFDLSNFYIRPVFFRANFVEKNATNFQVSICNNGGGRYWDFNKYGSVSQWSPKVGLLLCGNVIAKSGVFIESGISLDLLFEQIRNTIGDRCEVERIDCSIIMPSINKNADYTDICNFLLNLFQKIHDTFKVFKPTKLFITCDIKCEDLNLTKLDSKIGVILAKELNQMKESINAPTFSCVIGFNIDDKPLGEKYTIHHKMDADNINKNLKNIKPILKTVQK